MFKLFVIALRITVRIENMNWERMSSKRRRRMLSIMERTFDEATLDMWCELRKVPYDTDPNYNNLLATYYTLDDAGCSALQRARKACA